MPPPGEPTSTASVPCGEGTASTAWHRPRRARLLRCRAAPALSWCAGAAALLALGRPDGAACTEPCPYTGTKPAPVEGITGVAAAATSAAEMRAMARGGWLQSPASKAEMAPPSCCSSTVETGDADGADEPAHSPKLRRGNHLPCKFPGGRVGRKAHAGNVTACGPHAPPPPQLQGGAGGLAAGEQDLHFAAEPQPQDPRRRGRPVELAHRYDGQGGCGAGFVQERAVAQQDRSPEAACPRRQHEQGRLEAPDCGTVDGIERGNQGAHGCPRRLLVRLGQEAEAPAHRHGCTRSNSHEALPPMRQDAVNARARASTQPLQSDEGITEECGRVPQCRLSMAGCGAAGTLAQGELAKSARREERWSCTRGPSQPPDRPVELAAYRRLCERI
eukprot:scaffold9265_cov101-Isochrysis_galbana.AAC.1